MGRNLRITVDKSLCVTNRACVETAPGVFRIDADGKSEAADASASSEEKIIEAGLNCPVSAINVFDADTGEDLLDA